jgi:hypothetical protein
MKPINVKFNAVTFRYLLVGCLVVMAMLFGAGFYLGSQVLEERALAADHAKTDATLRAEDVAQLKRLEAELENKQDIVKRAQQIVSESRFYQYQDQIVHDINTYANVAGVHVSGYNFESQTGSSRSSRSSGSSAPNVPGVTAITATLRLTSPVPYTNFLRFLKAVEQNLTKMQVTGVNMTPDGDNRHMVNNPTVGLIIYVRPN